MVRKLRSCVEQTVIVRAVRHLEMVVYLRATERKLITWEVTVKGDWLTWQLGLQVAEQIVRDNPSVHRLFY